MLLGTYFQKDFYISYFSSGSYLAVVSKGNPQVYAFLVLGITSSVFSIASFINLSKRSNQITPIFFVLHSILMTASVLACGSAFQFVLEHADFVRLAVTGTCLFAGGKVASSSFQVKYCLP